MNLNDRIKATTPTPQPERPEPFVAPWRRRQLEQANGNRWVAVNDLTALVRER
jgi:hypothetical protein